MHLLVGDVVSMALISAMSASILDDDRNCVLSLLAATDFDEDGGVVDDNEEEDAGNRGGD